jgi:hypothetical protein
MASARHEQARERRHVADRRARPTTLWSTLRWQGRRTGFRRASEGHHAYVDGLSWRIGGLAILVYVGSLLDAGLTLLHLENGGSEANPLMHLALAHGPTVFIALKLSLTGLAAWWLAAHQQWSLAVRGLQALALGYGMVVVYHLVLNFHFV